MGIGSAPRVLIVDNIDSFTHNIAHLVASVTGEEPVVIANDDYGPDAVADLLDQFTHVIIGPGPGTPHNPADVGICPAVLAACAARSVPVLGICLGLQLMAVVEGGRVSRAPEPMHGLESLVTHTGDAMFEDVPSPFTVVRYHSLAITELPEALEVTARSEDGVIQAIRHRTHPFIGVQFHPESIRSDAGRLIIGTFLGIDLAPGSGTSAAQTGGPAPRRAPVGTPTAHPTHRLALEGPIPLTADGDALFRALYADDDTAVWLDSNSHDARAEISVMGALDGPDSHVITHSAHASGPGGSRVGKTRLRWADGSDTIRTGTTLAASARHQLAQIRVAPRTDEQEELPRALAEFQLGYVGFLGYGLKAETLGLPDQAPASTPDAHLLFLQRAVVIDHREQTIWLAELERIPGPAADDPAARREPWRVSSRRLIESVLAAGPAEPAAPAAVGGSAAAAADRAPLTDADVEAAITLRHDADAYRALIGRCQELIDRGDSYELCLTNEAEFTRDALGCDPADLDPLAVYERLRTIAEVPFGALLRCGDFSVIGASPERFIEVRSDGVIESRPIKGTARRGRTPEEDEQLCSALLASRKERAENLMIVDLVRNDLARVSDFGSVHVPSLFAIESFATVHQMISTVRGTLRGDCDALDVLTATFPGGSMTGAPKVRSVEILDELEQGPRGVYSGAIGWLSTNGSASFSIVIRTITAERDRVAFGVGGAITRLSTADEEFTETLIKARTVVDAVTRR
ncbi:aminodeoxychorismate synthase component I [Helcobacillus massiliensis]|uniref:aminodeoxychorismate synthase component I n=1 Tax=Helcobacillus massiliensis TaxID=521392 RepID=UPI0021A63D45|nr:aminodeoxychorismate synthase component I [Helcobacillus massiliensis]MCT1556518.1 aminodeoxychorismate synthase component I [Helcobacillus massiliensis]MCT2035712.1 aminodeoxychorismate synthase component I [Helcobacillus massiliensis]MCT2331206.1 aminodeoxychorismate synthase component I [Helcobacillus massiliensis]